MNRKIWEESSGKLAIGIISLEECAEIILPTLYLLNNSSSHRLFFFVQFTICAPSGPSHKHKDKPFPSPATTTLQLIKRLIQALPIGSGRGIAEQVPQIPEVNRSGTDKLFKGN